VSALQDALDSLARVAEKAQLHGDVARGEGADFAAAIAESAPRAAADWTAAMGGGRTQDFFDAATRARRWRASPTVLLTRLAADGSEHTAAYAAALAEVASAACGLGEPTMRVIGNASVAAAAQLQAAGVAASVTGHSAATTDGPVPPIWAPVTTSTPTTSTPTTSTPTAGEAARHTEAARTQPAPPQKSLDELLAELDALVGLARVKREVHRQVAMLRVEGLRHKAGLKNPAITRHLVFVGNPGTGKTTVARLVSGIYRALGLLSKGQLVEVDRSELVAGYLGQTAVKTAEVVASALGGVLFIDEAYSLTGDQYGDEAVASLVKEMEDHRDELVVIVAGYPAPMEAFIAANPGLASRFRTTITFEDYADEELADILAGLAGGADYELDDGARTAFREILASTERGMSFGNGRFARNVLEAAIGRHAWRLRDVAEPSTEQLRLLVAGDFAGDFVEDAAEDSGDGDPTAERPTRGTE
jgi:hypothetical protein